MRKVLLARLRQSSLTQPLLQLLYRVWPFFPQIRAARKSAAIALKELETGKLLYGKGDLIVRFDNRYCHPGMGDFFIVIMLANYLHDIGFSVTFSYILSNGNVHDLSQGHKQIEKQKMISEFLRLGVSPKISSSVTEEELDFCVFRDRIRNQSDIAGPSLLLLSLIFLSKILNPDRLRPLIWRESEKRSSSKIVTTCVQRIGFHVRASDENVFRNPELKTVLADFLALSKAFPSAEVIWFGEKAKFDEFLRFLAKSEKIVPPPIFQKSGSFPDAIIEAVSMDFWYQRFGGGIGASSLFTTLPYLILSGDVPATRLYTYHKKRIVPWAERSQRYILLNVTRGGLERWLRNLEDSQN
jgi:hypothetical protein